MKILHTADVHLQEVGDERWRALQELILAGKKESIDVLIISGDLFHRGVDAENLRTDIREVFSNNGFQVLIIPGNHDINSYTKGLYFGEDVTIISDLEKPWEKDGVKIWGMPFEEGGIEKTLENLKKLKYMTEEGMNVLLYHGELLDFSFPRQDFGPEGDARYMPSRLSFFAGLRLSYVLAGHYHSHFNIWQLDDKGYFVYPGSPVSITRKETGIRKANLFRLGEHPEEYLLKNTLHYEEIIVDLSPWGEQAPLSLIRGKITSLPNSARAILRVRGFINGEKLGMTEKELISEIRKIADQRCAVQDQHFEFRDIRMVLEDDLFKLFSERLEKRDYSHELKEDIRNLAIRAMQEVKS